MKTTIPPVTKVRKQCDQCGRKSLYPIRQNICLMSRGIGKPHCTGKVTLYSGDFDDAVLNLIAASREAAKSDPLLKDAIEDLETWVENAPATPREMGWVGQDGLP